MTTETPTLGLVLAGGLARRMGGGDKALTRIGGKTILSRVLARLTPQCTRHHAQRQRRSGALCRHSGCRSSPTACRISPGRSPAFSPGSTGPRRTRPDIAYGRQRAGRLPVPAARSRGAAARRRASPTSKPLACAHSGDWRHPVVGLWPVALRDDLRHALTVEDLRKIEVWTARHGVALADWPAEPVDPFFNVNTPEDAAASACERLS